VILRDYNGRMRKWPAIVIGIAVVLIVFSPGA
jgi:hypothetical protein